MADVFILGAGFSRAISAEMPLLAELPALLKKRAGPRNTWDAMLTGLGGNFEHLLTFLAQEQPWLSQADNLENRATFLRLSAQLGRVVAEQQNSATSAAAPEWLVRLVRRWEADKAPVVSLNYDTLVEKAYFAQGWGEDGPVRFPTQLYGGELQPLDDASHPVGVPERRTFRLLKLHGSVNWYYSGASSFFGESIQYAELSKVGWDDGDDLWAHPDDIDRWDDVARGKVPLVVPPTADKSPFFANELVRSQWQQAAFELRAPPVNVIFLGYSLPETDLLVRFLLSQLGRSSAVYVVNRVEDELAADGLKARYVSAMPDVELDTQFVGTADVLPAFVDAYLSGLS